jgi:malonyl-CoA O-methyltransferase
MGFWRRIRSLSPREGYDLWARSYHAEANPIKKMSDDFISEQLPTLTEKHVLDAGCGPGKFCVIATEQGASFVRGIDLSPAMIEEARKNCPTATFECADLLDASVESNQYDVVICGLVIGHVENHKPVLEKLAGALKKGGMLIITDFHPYQTMMKAKRTFTDSHSGKTFEVKHTLHKLDEYFALLRNAGLRLEVFKEPLFSGKPVIFGISSIKS